MMQYLSQWSPSVASWLAAFCFSSVVLGLVVWGSLRFMRRASSSTRFLLAQAAILGIASLAVIVCVTPQVAIFTKVTGQVSRSAHRTLAVSTTFDRRGQTEGQTPQVTNVDSNATPESSPLFSSAEPTKTVQTSVAAESKPIEAIPTRPNFDGRSLQLTLVTIWLMGASALLIRFIASSVLAWQITKRATRMRTDTLRNLLQESAKKMSLESRGIELAVTSDLANPFTFGIFNPVIVLPRESQSWSANKLAMVLLHELAHVDRRDVLWCWINSVVCAIAWFNPFTWLLSKRCAIEREHACDDRVVTSGVEPSDYGASLVEIGASLAGRPLAMMGAVAMSEPPLMQRLSSILAANQNRQRPSPGGTALCVTGLTFLVLLAGSVRPFVVVTNAQESSSTPTKTGDADDAKKNNTSIATAKKIDPKPITEPFTPPNTVSGTVKDHNGQPVAEAMVEVAWLAHIPMEDRNAYGTEVLKSWRVPTNSAGKFEVDLSAIGQMNPSDHLSIQSVEAKGSVLVRTKWLGANEIARGDSFDVALVSARRIRAQVLTHDGRAAKGAMVKAAGEGEVINDFWWSQGQLIEPDGSLSIYVPNDMDVEFLIYADNHAPTRFYVKRDDSILGKLQLQSGTSIAGRVLNEAGTGVAGTVVEVQMNGGCELDNVGFGASRATITDGDGNFVLGPCRGTCGISVGKTGDDTSQFGTKTLTGNPAPIMLPVEIELDGTEKQKQVVLQQGPTATIEGAATWENGKPVVGMQVTARAMLTAAGFDLDHAITDKDGRYRLELPIPLPNAYIMAFGMRDAAGTWHAANGDGENGRGSHQFINFEALNGDQQGVNWVLKVYDPPPQSAPESKAERELQALLEQARAGAEGEADPRDTMAPKYLAFEQAHRGTAAAVRALAEVASNARSVGDPASVAAQGRIEAVDRLLDYYLEHEELDQALGSVVAFIGGPPVPRADELLQAALDKSPHRKVKVAALLFQITNLRATIREVENVKSLPEFFGALPIANNEPDQLDAQAAVLQANAHMAKLRNLDPDELRRQATVKIKRLGEEFGEEPLHYYGIAFNAAKSLLHAVNQVIVGNPAPDIVATDMQGKPFRLSDHRDKVVVLFFGQDLFDNYENYGTIRTLVKDYADKPMMLVGIMSNDKQENLKAGFERGNLPWTVIPQTLNGPVQRDWGIEYYSTVYLVDRAGTLHGGFLVPYFPNGYDTERIRHDLDKLLEAK